MSDAQQTAGILQIGFRRGDEYRRTFTVNLDLTGYTLTWEIYTLRGDTVKLSGSLSFTTPPSSVGLTITEAQTATLLPGTYGFRAKWVATGTITRTFLEDICEVRR
jgi:hypothetical protein